MKQFCKVNLSKKVAGCRKSLSLLLIDWYSFYLVNVCTIISTI